jgi:glycine/serine hydroxymethyltransferase
VARYREPIHSVVLGALHHASDHVMYEDSLSLTVHYWSTTSNLSLSTKQMDANDVEKQPTKEKPQIYLQGGSVMS